PVGGDIDVVLFVDLVADIQVQVIERGRAVFIGIGQQTQQPVGIGCPGPEDERGLILDDRPFYVQPARQQAYTGGAGKQLLVAFPVAYIQYRGQPASVFLRYRAFIQLNVLDDIGV